MGKGGSEGELEEGCRWVKGESEGRSEVWLCRRKRMAKEGVMEVG